MGRQVTDSQLITTAAFPAAGANANSASFDLGAHANAATAILPEELEARITWPTLPNLADTKKVTFTIQDSADNVTFAALDGLSHALTGAGGAGVVAGSFQFRFPSNTRQYVRVNAAIDALGGDSTALSFTFDLRF